MSQVRLLLVDDEERFLATTRTLLEKREVHNIQTVTNGEDALAILRKDRISVVVLDVRMPGLDGMEVLSDRHTRSWVYLVARCAAL